MTGSFQLQRYLDARFTDGLSLDDAAFEAGFTVGEARLTDAAVEKGEIEIPTNRAPRIGETPGGSNMSDQDLLEREPTTDTEATETEATNERGNAAINLASDTLRGDIRDSLLDWLKATPKPWPQLSEGEQVDRVLAADSFSALLIRQVCQIVAANERPCIVATLTEYKEKDGVEAKLKLPSRGEVVAALHEACGREVLIVTSGAEEFMGESGPAEISPDQSHLGIGAEYEDA